MKVNVVVGGIALGLLLAARPAQAQFVQTGVVIHSGPVTGHVIVGEPAPYPPRVIVVERSYGPRGRPVYWSRGYGYRPVVVYYDGHRYYDRWFDGCRGLRRIQVYERGGRYYRWRA